MLSNLMHQLGGKSTQIETDLLRHMILNTVRSLRNKFCSEYGEFIICCDDKNYWRKDIFFFFKAHRKKDRETSVYDWNHIFSVLNAMRDDFKHIFPYRVLHIERTEADDIIAAMCHHFGAFLNANSTEKIMILSSDKDFIQLQKYSNVEQYSPVQKKKVQHNNPYLYIKEHIMKGDRGDGIPNFLSDDDTFVTGKRQKPISKKKLDVWVDKMPEEFCDEKMLRGYKRNEALVNLDLVPSYIFDNTIDMYENYQMNDRTKLFDYFIKNKLKHLMEHLGEF